MQSALTTTLRPTVLLSHQRRRLFSTTGRAANGHREQPPRSPHAQFYSDLLPAMIPVALLGSAVFLGLQLTQTHLSQEKYLDEARAHVDALEAEVDALAAERRASAHPASGAAPARSGASEPGGWSRWFK